MTITESINNSQTINSQKTKTYTSMKKLILTTLCVASTLSVLAQGTVAFQTVGTSPIYLGTTITNAYPAANRATGATIASQTTTLGISTPNDTGVIDVGLLWGTSATSVNTLAGFVNMGGTAGQIAGNTVYAVPGTNPGDNDWFEVIAWDSSYGNTLAGATADVAAGGYWGSAGSTAYGVAGPALQFVLGPTSGPGLPLFGSAATTGVFHLFALITPTPEPATLALGGLGAAALLLFRRRK
jgi:hypothetical protein